MSDDRFKQARRSLIDRNKEREQDRAGRGRDHREDDEFDDDDETLMVNVDEFHDSNQPDQRRQTGDQRQSGSRPPNRRQPDGRSGHNASRSNNAPRSSGRPPAPNNQSSPPSDQSPPSGGHASAVVGDDDFADAATELVDLNNLEGSPNHETSGHSGHEESTSPAREALPADPASSPAGRSSPPNQHVFAPGGGTANEDKTDFINVSDFADRSTNEFAPDSQSAGHEGKTAFVHIDSLKGSKQQPRQPGQPRAGASADGIASDSTLRRSYQFDAQSIQHGDVTLIFAQNPLGRSVVLRQLWAGDASEMPADLRRRIAQLDDIDHPRLVRLNGVLATETGMWAELERPEGYRLAAVLDQHGPQDKANVFAWLDQISSVLDVLHDHELLYANLTPAAIWIQEDNSILLEPFDLLSFEKRGDLGPYGAPELSRRPDDRPHSPATDIYSLAAVGAAALTGTPLHLEGLANLDDQALVDKLRAGLADQPADRPRRASQFTDDLKSTGSLFEGVSLDPAELDIKIVAAIAFLLVGGLAGYMYLRNQRNQPPANNADQPSSSPTTAGKASASAAGPTEAAGGHDGPEGADRGPADRPGGSAESTEPSVDPPGPVDGDPRLKIATSYQLNPSAKDGARAMSDTEVAQAASAKRKAAKKHIQTAKHLRSDNDKLDEYTDALQIITEAIRLNGGEPTDRDQKILDELHARRAVRTYEADLRKRIASALNEGAASDASFSYKRLHSIDYRARANDFFVDHPHPGIRSLQPTATGGQVGDADSVNPDQGQAVEGDETDGDDSQK